MYTEMHEEQPSCESCENINGGHVDDMVLLEHTHWSFVKNPHLVNIYWPTQKGF